MSIPDLVTIGTSTGGHAIVNQGMITRTPNGDLYASCGDMGQNHDLSIGNGQPIIIWYSNDDGATWVVSKTIYVDRTFGTDDEVYGWRFGGGGAVHIACDSEGDVKIAFAIRKAGDHYQTPDVTKGWFKSLNTVAYLHGKHGAWGDLLSIFYVENYVDLDALPKVTSLAVDSNNLPHILFEVGTYGGAYDYIVYHLHWPGSGPFDYTLIWTDSYWVARSRMVIDGNDTVHVTLYNAGNGKWYHKCKAVAGGWGASVLVGLDTSYYFGPAMAVDKDNVLHLATYGTGQYRQRSPAGVWSSVEDAGFSGYDEPSISISQDGIVHIAAHKSWSWFKIRKRVDGVWSNEELWSEGSSGWGVCLLHSYWPKIDTQHINILETGWAFHWRPVHYTSFYKADFTKDAYVTTDPATLITAIAATLNGTLVYDGEENCTCGFDYGLTDSYGSQIEALADYYNTGESFFKLITDLLPATTYHFRARATNSAGTFYGADLTFTTIGGVYPSEVTTRVSALIHRWVPGSYTLEVVLGGLTSEYGLRVPSGKPTPTIPEIPSCPPGYVLSWSLERGYFCISEADIPPTLPETMEEYY